MANNYGKKFEQQFKGDWEKSFPNSPCIRLPDQQSGYYGTSRNICDYICFVSPNLYLLECKSIKGNTFPLSNFSQFDNLSKFVGMQNVVVGVILWFYDHDKIFFVPYKTFHQLMVDGKKSVNIKYENDDKYKMYLIPSEKRRVYLSGDYRILKEIGEEKNNGKYI